MFQQCQRKSELSKKETSSFGQWTIQETSGRLLSHTYVCSTPLSKNNISTLDYGEKNGNGAKRLWSGMFNLFERMLKY
jgi:hypothetical protein